MKLEKLLTALALVATTGIGLTALIAILQTCLLYTSPSPRD